MDVRLRIVHQSALRIRSKGYRRPAPQAFQHVYIQRRLPGEKRRKSFQFLQVAHPMKKKNRNVRLMCMESVIALSISAARPSWTANAVLPVSCTPASVLRFIARAIHASRNAKPTMPKLYSASNQLFVRVISLLYVHLIGHHRVRTRPQGLLPRRKRRKVIQLHTRQAIPAGSKLIQISACDAFKGFPNAGQQRVLLNRI